MSGPQSDVINAIASELAAFGGSAFGGPDVVASESAPPFYVWEPIDADIKGPGSVGGVPRALYTGVLSFDVHCHGADFDGAWRLACALATVLEKVTAADARLRKVRFTNPASSGDGTIATASVEISIPVPETLATAGEALARVTSTRIAPPTGAVDGDGVLNVPLS